MALRPKWQVCPQCGKPLTVMHEEGEPYHTCSDTACRFIDYNNPIPVVALLIPHGDGIVLVERGKPPFVGRWCLPRGFIRSNANPKGMAVEEGRTETGLLLCLHRILTACNPSPANFPLNQLTMFFLATAYGGALQAGDDARNVGVFKPDAWPDLCFGSDIQVLTDWYSGQYGTVDQPINFRPPRSLSADST